MSVAATSEEDTPIAAIDNSRHPIQAAEMIRPRSRAARLDSAHAVVFLSNARTIGRLLGEIKCVANGFCR
jgi:hypothetical protein